MSLQAEIRSFKVVNSSIIDSIVTSFDLPEPLKDVYKYAQESSSVTLRQAQKDLEVHKVTYQYVQAGQIVTIKATDIDAYVNIFKSSTDTENALNSFFSNAKKLSPRQMASAHLCMRRLRPASLQLTKRKNHVNPYFDLWAICCHDLGFLGPLSDAGYSDPQAAKQSHSLLPIFMHHFGCAVPSYEALLCVKVYATDKLVLDVGCGNGYWTAMLRDIGVKVLATDDCSSTWRNSWITDIVKSDAIQFLKARETTQEVLLLVYPITGHNLTRRILKEFRGNTVIIVGTQNANRYTTFADATVEEYYASQPEWELILRIALPSFPGKDDAVHIICKKDT